MLMIFFSIRLVIETLKDVTPERKCFRMVGGVLVERTVKDVLPALVNNKDQVKMFFHLVMIFPFLDIIIFWMPLVMLLFFFISDEQTSRNIIKTTRNKG